MCETCCCSKHLARCILKLSDVSNPARSVSYETRRGWRRDVILWRLSFAFIWEIPALCLEGRGRYRNVIRDSVVYVSWVVWWYPHCPVDFFEDEKDCVF